MRDNKHINILVVDDEENICDVIVEALSSENYHVDALSDPRQALDYIEHTPVDLLLTDLVMGEFSGERLVDATLALHQDAVVILMTAHPTVRTAISVLKRGAFDFLVKPFKLELLRATVSRGLQHQRLARENLSLRGQVAFLKVASAFQTGAEIGDFLRQVVRSCKEEMTAGAAGLIEIDAGSGSALRKIADSDDPAWVQEVLDEATVWRFIDTKRTTPTIRTEVVEEGGRQLVKSFVSQPILILARLHGVINLVVRSRFDRLTPGQLDILTILTNSAASAIANNHLYRDLRTSYLQAIRGLANAIEARDRCTRGHTERVSRLAELVARHLGWTDSQLQGLVMGCSLHDVGKIGVPDSVLNKQSELTADEQRLMYNHPLTGLKIIEGIAPFEPAIPYIIAHHERYDGRGYPYGLKGHEIPIEGRLLAVVDAFDAIMANRPYRKGAHLRAAVMELMAHKGTQFDPEVVDRFVEILVKEPINYRQMYDRDEDPETIRDLLVSEKAPA